MHTKVITYNAATSAPMSRTGYVYPAPSGRVVTSTHRKAGQTGSKGTKVRLVVGKGVKIKGAKTPR